MSNRKLFKIAGYVGLITIISKVIGLIRDLVIANIYGTNLTADAYNFAYLLTGNALILLGGLGGPFHSATVATLTRVKDSPEEAGNFLARVFSSTVIILSIIMLITICFSNDIVQIIAPASGLSEAYRQALWTETSAQLRIMSPMIVISGILGIACGIGNVYGGYFLPSIGPAITSLLIICSVLIYKSPTAGLALALGTTIGAVFQFFIQVPDILKPLTSGKIKVIFLKGQTVVKEYYEFLGPALLSTTIGQLTVYVDGFFCSGLDEGSWTATIFANRLIQLPLGVLSTAFLVPFFPRFSELANEKKIDELKQTAILVIKSLWYLTLPIAAYMFLFSNEIVSVLFERGAFNERSTELVSGILLALLLSMIAYIARDTLTRVFYSLGDSKIPLLVAGISIAAKFILNSLLVEKYQASGIAFATSIVTVINFLILGFILKNKIGDLGWTKNLKSIVKTVFATIIMFALGFWIKNYLDIANYNFISKLMYLMVSSSICFGTYFLISIILKIEESEKILREIRTRFKF